MYDRKRYFVKCIHFPKPFFYLFFATFKNSISQLHSIITAISAQNTEINSYPMRDKCIAPWKPAATQIALVFFGIFYFGNRMLLVSWYFDGLGLLKCICFLVLVRIIGLFMELLSCLIAWRQTAINIIVIGQIVVLCLLLLLLLLLNIKNKSLSWTHAQLIRIRLLRVDIRIMWLNGWLWSYGLGRRWHRKNTFDWKIHFLFDLVCLLISCHLITGSLVILVNCELFNFCSCRLDLVIGSRDIWRIWK